MTHPHEGLQERALKPCPFCGGDELSHGYTMAGGQMIGNAECHTCGVYIVAEDEASAIENWNTRADPLTGTPPVPQDQGLRDALERIANGKEPGQYLSLVKCREIAAEALATLPQQAATDEGDRIAAAIKATEYKYFGDYEMSDEQREAVDVLVETAKRYALTQPEPTAQQAGSDWFAGDVDVDGNELITVRKDEWEKLIEQRDKFKWQVRDTCVRAEKAEAAQQATDCPDCDGTGYRQASTAHKGGECPTCAATGDRLAQQAAGEAEAVAWSCYERNMGTWYHRLVSEKPTGDRYRDIVPLYATPQPTETPIKRIEDGHADTEGEAAERFAHLNCPTCGGSGHIDDVQPTETQRIVAGLNEVRDLMLERIQGSPARSAAHNARVRLETIIRELSGEHLAGEGDKA